MELGFGQGNESQWLMMGGCERNEEEPADYV